MGVFPIFGEVPKNIFATTNIIILYTLDKSLLARIQPLIARSLN